MHLVLWMILLLCMNVGMGLAALFHEWSQSLELQLKLDRCLGQETQALTGILNFIHRSNQALRLLRAGETLSVVFLPTVAGSLKASLTLIARLQDARLLEWKIRQGPWKTPFPCGFLNPPNSGWKKLEALFLAPSQLFSEAFVPALRYRRPPSDALGEQPLVWESLESLPPKAFFLWIRQSSRQSAAKIDEDSEHWLEPWKMRWASLHEARRGSRFESSINATNATENATDVPHSPGLPVW